MKLTELIERLEHAGLIGVDNCGPPVVKSDVSVIEILSIHYSSKDMDKGGLFVAIPGHTVDGHNYIDDAVGKGAVAIISEKEVKANAVVITVENSRKALANISSAFFRNPSKKMSIVGITGTNGKTTITYLLENILTKAGLDAGVIGTVNYRYKGKVFESGMTTPESLDLQKILNEMVSEGVTHGILEVSSHAIDLARIDECFIDIGVFTNLSQDHLDYHGDMDSYWECKKKLFFENIRTGPKKDEAIAVINCNNEKGRELFGLIAGKKISTGFSEKHDVFSTSVKSDLTGISGTIHTPKGTFDFNSPLVGMYNLENILSATGVAIALEIDSSVIKSGIEDFSGVPGRLERVQNDVDRFVFVDYAHTPDALENVLSALKAITTGRIISIFGCGGDRDRTKRPLMGELGGKLSDLCVITSDNPRTEMPLDIIDQIIGGVRRVTEYEYPASGIDESFAQKGYTVEPDRRRAITIGITASRPGDAVLIAGKGHETYQIIGKNKIDFDDKTEAKSVLNGL